MSLSVRNIIGSVLAVVGAALTLVSPWQAWYNGRHGSTYKFYEVFGTGITASKSGIMDSVFLVFLITAIVTVVGVVMRSRVVVGVAGVIAFGFTILWMIRQGNAAGELTISSNSRGLGVGVAFAFGGSLLMIIGALVMTSMPMRIMMADRDRGGARTVGAAGAAGAAGATTAPAATRAPESSAIPTNPPTPSAPAKPVRPAPPPAATTGTQGTPTTPPAERTGTERLSKEEREMLGLDQDTPSRGKQEK
ncbi:hypothetical protein [Catenulispora subtropica]|uniref:Uncharacterized protein n=1 Tax=Catenulispora subtropica TaxID=450798 RepID=A0ABP5BV64_9ACTN